MTSETERLAAEYARGLTDEELWDEAFTTMERGLAVGSIDSGLLRLVDACLVELVRRRPELASKDIDDFLRQIREALAASPSNPIGHA